MPVISLQAYVNLDEIAGQLLLSLRASATVSGFQASRFAG